MINSVLGEKGVKVEWETAIENASYLDCGGGYQAHTQIKIHHAL